MQRMLPLWFVVLCATVVVLVDSSDAQGYLHPSLGRFLQRDPLGYVDGMNTYQYLQGAPHVRLDPLGTQTTQPATTRGSCCCITSPDDCEVVVDFLGQNDGMAYTGIKAKDWHKLLGWPPIALDNGKLRVFHGGVPVHIYIKSKAGNDVTGCNLQQDTIDKWHRFADGTPDDEPVGVDYSSTKTPKAGQEKGKEVYFGWEFWDFPMRAEVYNYTNPKLGSVSDKSRIYEAYFWQAKVFVEEMPNIDKYWGWRVQGDYTKPQGKQLIDHGTWSADKPERNPYEK